MKELLVPVGSPEHLISAINAGADAVYLSGKDFGARKFASNFTNEEIESAINLCHLYNVKVYITINTLIYNNEFNKIDSYLTFLSKCNPDAVIMQDIGLINYTINKFPSLTVHASTQCHVHNENVVKFLENLGVKRVVFARELDIDYINNIKTNVEKEVFIHGALCISYSGCCLFSKFLLNRSANRGLCASICRFPCNLYKNNKKIINNKYLLSTKELCTLDEFKKLMDSNILSFKIEGRMKSKEYVYYVTKLYKDLMNKYYNNEELKYNIEDYNMLKSIYNRDFTSGYLFNNNDILNIDSPNHIGLLIGTVVEIKKKICIKLNHELKQFDSIRFGSNEGMLINFMYDKNDNLINKANKYVYLDKNIDVSLNDKVYLTKPYIKLDNNITKKLDIDINVYIRHNEKIKINITCLNTNLNLEYDAPSKSINRPIVKENIIKQFSKLGDTPYIINNINIDMDNNSFISLKTLNFIRRDFIDKLNEERLKKKEIVINEYKIDTIKKSKTNKINVVVRNKKQLDIVKKYDVEIYTDNKSLVSDNVYYIESRNNLDSTYIDNSMVRTLSSLYNNVVNITDYTLNILNKYSLDLISRYSNMVCLSLELEDNDLKEFDFDNYNVELYLYGYPSAMIIKNKILENDTMIELSNNKYYVTSCNDYTNIYDYKPINKINNMSYYKSIGITNFRVEFLNEEENEIKNIMEKVMEYGK